MARLFYQRQVHSDKIGCRINLVGVGQFGAEGLGHFARDYWIVAEHLHAKGVGAQGHFAADLAQPEHAERFAAQFDACQLAAIPQSRLE